MKQVIQNFKTGALTVEEVPPPAVTPGEVLVQTAFSVISGGTERMAINQSRPEKSAWQSPAATGSGQTGPEQGPKGWRMGNPQNGSGAS